MNKKSFILYILTYIYIYILIYFSELNLSRNRLSTLPDEISECTQLEKVDISHNSFISIPQVSVIIYHQHQVKVKSYILITLNEINNNDTIFVGLIFSPGAY